MAVEEPRRMALHRAVTDAWGEEAADTLFELVAPSGHELATRADIQMILEALEAMDRRWDERFAASEIRQDERLAAAEQRWQERFAASEDKWDARFTATEDKWDERFTATEDKWDARHATSDARLEAMEHRLTAAFERGIREAITVQTRTLLVSQLTVIVMVAGLAFGLR